MSNEMTSAATEAMSSERPRPATAPATTSDDASNTMSWPAPKPRGSSRLPWVPPIALAQPPPFSAVVSHGIHALAHTSPRKARPANQDAGGQRH